MTTRHNLDARVAALERGHGKEVVLNFYNGSSRAIRLRHPLGVLCAAMAKISWAIGPPEGREPKPGERAFRKCAGAPCPRSPYDAQIDLLGAAESVISSDDLVQLALQTSRQALEKGAAESENYVECDAERAAAEKVAEPYRPESS